MLNNLHLTSLKLSQKQLTRFLSSLCFSLVSIQLLKCKELLLSITFQSVTRNSQIFPWVKVSNLSLRRLSSMLLRKVTGSYCKIFILCKLGSRVSMDWRVCWKQFLPTVIPTSESCWVLNLLHFLKWKSFLNLFCKFQLRLLTKLLNIWRQTCEEHMPTSVKRILTDARKNQTNSRHVSSLYVTSTLWSWAERNSVLRVGQECTLSTMVIWLFAEMCCTTIWVNTTSFLGKIWNTSLVRSCMEDTSLTIGIEELTQLISEFCSSLNFYYPTSTCSIICSSPQILPNLIIKDTKSILKRSYLLKFLKCLECILMLKLDTWLFNARLFSILFFRLKEDQEELEVETRTNKPWLSLLILKAKLLKDTLCLILQQRSRTLKIKHHLLLSACKNVREWIPYWEKSREVLKTWDWVLQVPLMLQMLWRLFKDHLSSTKCQLPGRKKLIQVARIWDYALVS